MGRRYLVALLLLVRVTRSWAQHDPGQLTLDGVSQGNVPIGCSGPLELPIADFTCSCTPYGPSCLLSGSARLDVSSDTTTIVADAVRVDMPSGSLTVTAPGSAVANVDLSANVTMMGATVGDVASESIWFPAGSTHQTCGTGNQGRHRVLTDASVEYCKDDTVSTVYTLVEKDLTQTLTGKTYDAEATGNVLTMPVETPYPVALCLNNAATNLWDTTAASLTTPAPTCTGSNVHDAVLAFDGTTSECVEKHLILPTTWVGAIDVLYKWQTTVTTGSATWCSLFICVADNEGNDPTYPAMSSSNCVSDPANTNAASRMNDVTDTNVTATGCAAGEILHWKICRDPAAVSGLTDDITADASLEQVLLRYRVQL